MFSRGIILALGLWTSAASADTPRTWSLAADPHFEVYAQGSPESARTALGWLQRLRSWVIGELGVQPDRLRPARVIGFASPLEYAPFRLHENSDAYYIGTEGRDYIVMVMAGPNEFGIAAHEYAHLVLHSAGLKLPPWLGEGLADLFGAAAGGNGRRPEHVALLRRGGWIPIGELLRMAPEERERQAAGEPSLFYAESWALTGMLAFSPGYQSKLRVFMGALVSGMSGEAALATVYGKTAGQAESDVRAWLDRAAATPLTLPPAEAPASTAEISRTRLRLLLATLLLDSGERGRAEAIYRDLPLDGPEAGDVHAGLAVLAYYAGDRTGAREHVARAVELGATDDALLFRYAALAGNAGWPQEELRPALERAIAIRPEFDDARFQLALMAKNEGHFEAAIAHLQAMKTVAPSRAFAYWSAMSDALNASGRFADAEKAAEAAMTHARSGEERVRATELSYLARTEVAVQLMPDEAGRPRMVTTRVPRQTTDWNPFVDPRDDVRRAAGRLREIDCSGGKTRFLVETAGGRIALTIPDPTRVQMRNAPDEFTCGPQEGRAVSVVYAAALDGGILRGIEFK
jgi:hypothetical protein